MADINEELLRALDGPAPQHKKYGEQAFEFTEGEQGKLFTGNHVMTDSGLWIPQKGSDDGAAHTQLSGSNVAKIHMQDVTVSPGSNHNIGDVDFKHSKIIIGVRLSIPTDFTVRVFPKVTGLGITLNDYIDIIQENDNDRVSAELPLETDRYQILFVNRGSVDVEVRALQTLDLMI